MISDNPWVLQRSSMNPPSHESIPEETPSGEAVGTAGASAPGRVAAIEAGSGPSSGRDKVRTIAVQVGAFAMMVPWG